MQRELKRALVLTLPAAVLGLALLYSSGLGGYDPEGCSGCLAYGRPMYWTIYATGTGDFLNLGAIALDFGFWFAVSLSVVWVLSTALAARFDKI